MQDENTQDTNRNNPVSDLTPEQVRRELVRLVDGVYIEQADTGAWLVIDHDTITHRYAKRAWAEKRIDAISDKYKSEGAAYLLCISIALHRNFEIITCPYPNTIIVEFRDAYDDTPRGYAEAPTPAEALARLALAALEGGAG